MMLDRLTTLRNKWSILIIFIFCLLLFPIFGMVYFSSFVSDNSSIVMRKHATVLLPYGTEDSLCSMQCESKSFETAFFTNVHVTANTTFPLVPEINDLSHYVNERLRKEACELHDTFAQSMSSPQEDDWEGDSNEYTLQYELNLVCSTPSLMSFYGSKYQYCGGAHGAVRYITKTFWNQDGTICELTLDDLFMPGYREWLFQYCENYFKSNRYGYYSYDDDYSWVGFNPKDLDSFILTEKGLLLIFQNYVIWGYDDYPVTLLIPYAELTSIAHSDKPWSLDYFSMDCRL